MYGSENPAAVEPCALCLSYHSMVKLVRPWLNSLILKLHSTLYERDNRKVHLHPARSRDPGDVSR